jgi:hypothetical protein
LTSSRSTVTPPASRKKRSNFVKPNTAMPTAALHQRSPSHRILGVRRPGHHQTG